MLQSIFGFRGRLGRLAYFLTAVAIGIAFLVVFVALMFAFGFHAGDRGAILRAMIPALVVAGSLWIWTGLSIQACRIRDIGWDPLIVILAWFGANIALRVVEFVAFHPTPGVHHADPLGMLISLANLVMGGVLLFWPGRGDGWSDGRADAGGGGDPGREAVAPAAPSPVAPAYAAAMRPANAGFGRRGL